MKLHEIADRLMEGKMTIDTRGHLTNPVNHELIIRRIIENLRSLKEKYKEEEKDDKGYWDLLLNWEHETGDVLHDTREVYCFNCGQRSALVMVDENTLSLLDTMTTTDLHDKWKEKHGTLKGFKVHMDDDIPMCSVIDLVNSGKMSVEIECPTGEIVFQNYFKTDRLYDYPEDVNQYEDENSINCIKGRYSLMKTLAKENVGYGQMGNMSVNVFKNDPGTEVLIGGDYYYDKDDQEHEFNGNNFDHFPQYKGFKNLGSISLSVWRWQCADKQVLIDANEPLPEEHSAHSWSDVEEAPLQRWADTIIASCQPGTWVVEHYFDLQRGGDKKDNMVYSRLYLKAAKPDSNGP